MLIVNEIGATYIPTPMIDGCDLIGCAVLPQGFYVRCLWELYASRLCLWSD